MKRWFVVRTKVNRERKIAIEIAKTVCPVYLPLHHELQRNGDRLESQEVGLLFPRYLFVIVDIPKRRAMKIGELPVWGKIRSVRGVERIMCRTTGDPIPVPYREMRRIRTRGRKKMPRKWSSGYREGQGLKVQTGPFANFDAMFEGDTKQRVKALVSIFGRQVSIEFEPDDVVAA